MQGPSRTSPRTPGGDEGILRVCGRMEARYVNQDEKAASSPGERRRHSTSTWPVLLRTPDPPLRDAANTGPTHLGTPPAHRHGPTRNAPPRAVSACPALSATSRRFADLTGGTPMSRLATQLPTAEIVATRVRRGPTGACDIYGDGDLADWRAVERLRLATCWADAHKAVDETLEITEQIDTDKFRYHWRRACWHWTQEQRRASL